MRPEDFSPGNMYADSLVLIISPSASMRPEDFSPGNLDAGGYQTLDVERASMRPEDFSPGNPAPRPAPARSASRFNEAGGFLPRKRGCQTFGRAHVAPALQ